MSNHTAIKKTQLKFIIILLLFVAIGMIFRYSTAKAVTTITVTDSWTWNDLKTAIEQTYKNQTVNFSINRTTPLLADSQITIPNVTEITLTCTNANHSMHTPDISRDKAYHGHFFKVPTNSTLNVSCCISGGSDTTDGLLLYEYNKETKTTTRVTDKNELEKYVTKLGGSDYHYSPINFEYYGSSLITVTGGTLNVNENSVLKYNYNPYSSSNTNDYNEGIYSYNTREIVNKYYETINDRTFLLAYYNLPCLYDSENNEPLGAGGSAISNKEGLVNIKNAQIYGCSSDDGPGIISESDDEKTVTINSTAIYKNVARNTGGGILFISTVPNPTTPYQLNIIDSQIYHNRAYASGGGLITGCGATVKVSGGSIYENSAEVHGGGFLANMGPREDTEKISGGKALLSNVKIYNNTAGGNAGGLGSAATESTWNYLTVNNCEIYNNSSLGTYTPTAESANTGYGGGIYSGHNCTLLVTEKSIIRNNISSGGISKASGENSPSGGRGGGIYVSGGECTTTITNSFIQANTAKEFQYNDKEYTGSGGGIYTTFTSNVTINGKSRIKENIADTYGGGIFNTGNLNLAGGTIFENTAKYGAGLYNNASGTTTLSGAEIYNNTATKNGGGISNSGNLIVEGGKVYSNTAVNGGGICVAGDSSKLTMTDGEISKNNAAYGGGIYLSSKKIDCAISGGSVHSNTANYGGGIYTAKDNKLTLAGLNVYDNIAVKDGGGIQSNGNLTIDSGFYYGNTKAGVSAVEGTLTINGGYYGFSEYTSDSDYQVSRNTDAQIIIGTNSICEVTGTNTTRVVSQMLDNEAIYLNKTNIGIKNAGKFYVNNTCKPGSFNIYGTGVTVNNSGTFNVNGAMIITSSEKDGANTRQDRVGIINTGTLDFNCDDAEISYCGHRGVDNDSIFYLKKGSIYQCSTEFFPKIESENGEKYARHGGGIANSGTFHMSGGKIYNNYAEECGGGIITGCSMGTETSSYKTTDFTMSGGQIYGNKADVHGGGIAIYNRSSSCEITGGVIGGSEDKANIAGDCGGGIYTGDAYVSSNETPGIIKITGCEVSYNKSEDGAGIALLGTHETTISSSNVNIHHNNATLTGGGIHLRVKDVKFSDGVNIHNNIADRGAGLYIDKVGSATVENCIIEYNEAAKTSGGIANNGELVLSNSTVVQHNKTTNGTAGGISNGGTLTLDNASVNNNSATGTGGGISNGGILNILKGAKIHSNTSKGMGAGLLNNGSNAVTNMMGGAIYSNKADSSGGGIALLSTSIVNISGGEIYDNTASIGGGIFIFSGSTVNVTDGIIHSNVATARGNGVYLQNNATFKMSKTALVEDNNVVYLEKDAFITVPEVFTDNKDIRAYVTGANLVTGRIIAKFGNSTDDSGSEALYWDTFDLEMTKQYFVVNGHILRSGDQGAAENTDAINNQDVFLSEEYNVDFDMNPPEIKFGSKITHSIGSNETVFDDLGSKKAHTVTNKYWYEPVTIEDTGHASYADNSADFANWSLAADGTGTTYEPDQKNVVIAAEINENITVYAQWSSLLIDVDYNGNGATEGENWTDEKVSLKGTGMYKLSDKNTAFKREETRRTSDKRLFRFMGWSFEKDAFIKEYDFGEEIDTTVLKAFVRTAENRDRQFATLYAVWDEFPTIEAIDRWFTLEEAHNGDITLKELLSSAKATDGDVGDVTDFYDKKPDTDALHIKGKEEFTIIDFNEEDFKAFTTSGNVTVTYKAVDSVGNETYKTVIVHIVDKDEQKYDETSLFTRFISSRYFKDANDDFVAPEYGGLNENSKWRTNAEHVTLLSSTLSNTKDSLSGRWNTVTETWDWSMEEIELCKSFVATHGVGNTHNPTALVEFYNQFGPEN